MKNFEGQLNNTIPSPRENPNLFGHEEAIKLLFKSYLSGKISHSWLIQGPKGIGKATLAFNFARFLLNQKHKTSNNSLNENIANDTNALNHNHKFWTNPELPVFNQVAAGTHSNLLTIERSIDKTGKQKNSILIDQVRVIKKFLEKSATDHGWKIVIIDSVEEMNVFAANAILKMLESPPKNSILLLVCHKPNKLLPTITSRCRKLTLTGLLNNDMKRLLTKFFPSMNNTEQELLVQISEGRIGYAISLASSKGLEIYRDILGLLSTLPQLNTPNLQQLLTHVDHPNSNSAIIILMELLSGIFSRQIRHGYERDLKNLPTLEQNINFQILPNENPEQWLLLWEKINNLTFLSTSINLDPKHVVLNMFLEIEKLQSTN